MEFLKVLALRGPNVWAGFPVLEAWVELGRWADTPSERIEGFGERLATWLSAAPRRGSADRLQAFLEQLRSGAPPAEVLAGLTLYLQAMCGSEATFGQCEPASDHGVVRVAVQYREEALGRACLATAREVCVAAIRNEPYDLPAKLQRLRDLAEDVCLGPSTLAIVRAAEARGIPYCRLNNRSLVQLGHGARQHRIMTAETDRTGAIPEFISQDKALTKRLLRSAGVPVPEGRLVSDADDAWAAACEIGPPVVIKPLNGNHGRGVFTDLTSLEQIRAVFPFALEEGDGVLVERFARGSEHRLLVVGDRVVAAIRGDPAVVVGDGRRTVAELVEELNRDPRRGDDDDVPLNIIEFGRATRSLVRQQGYEPGSIPASGVQVILQRNGNLGNDVTDQVHPDVAQCAVRAARAVGLDVAGLDIVTEDISRPLEAQGGVVVEVNAGPGLQMHLQPSTGIPRPVGEAIVAHLFKEGENGRIPLVGVLGGPAASRTTGLIAEMLRLRYGKVAMTCAEDVFFDGRMVGFGPGSQASKARDLLLNPLLEAAVLDVVPCEVLDEGLGFDRCRVAVVEASRPDVDTAQQRAQAAKVLLGVVDPAGAAVLDADDPLTPSLAAGCPGASIVFAESGEHPVLQGHRARGGRVAFVGDGAVVLAGADRQQCSIPLPPLAGGSRAEDGGLTNSRLAAAAAGWALRLPPDAIAACLKA